MILSGRDIQRYIERGALHFTPALDPEQFQQNGVDLILAEVEGAADMLDGFCLGRTREYIVMPADLMAFVELRSSWARRGILIPPTVIDAGFEGELTLEIVAHRPVPVPLHQRFAHVIFAQLSSPADVYRGVYQGQRGIVHARTPLHLRRNDS